MNNDNRLTLDFWAHENWTMDDPINRNIWRRSPMRMEDVHPIGSDRAMNNDNRPTLDFWAHEDRAKGDEINRDIWETSPMRMGAIHDVRTDGVGFTGEFGCQQAMVCEQAFTVEAPRLIGAYDDDEPLPWIPDWVGNRHGSGTGVTLVGPSYPPIIIERALYWAGMPLADYRTAGSADEFLTTFTEQILRDGDFSHFTQIESMLFPFRTAADICYFNLCRGSFVTRCQRSGDDQYGDERLDGSHLGETPARRLYHLLYNDYVKAAEDWTWQRLLDSRSGAVIALGKVAEHGLLRLFRRKGATITCASDGREWNPPALNDEVFWPSRQADDDRPVEYWIERSGRWWNVSMPDVADWCILPVHSLDAVEKEDSGYRRTRRILERFLDSER